MKNTFYSVITLVVLLSSCTKEDYGQYHEVPENPTEDTTSWEAAYQNAGTLPVNAVNDTNNLAGTTWVLTEYREGNFTTITLNPPDTLVFIQEHMYSYNGQIYTYGLYSSGNVWKLDLYDSMRFGYISGSIPGSFMRLGEFYLKKFYYNDIGMTGHVFITMIKVS